jgi:hypothetical protein
VSGVGGKSIITETHMRLQKEKGMENRGREEFETITLKDHLSLDEIRIKMQTRPGFLTMQKWLVIYNFIVHPRPLSQIAMHTGLAEATVHRIVSDYNRLGPEAFDMNRTKPFHGVS